MFVKAPVLNRYNNTKNIAKFLVEFAHSPVKKGHRRTCTCKIYACSGDDVNVLEKNFPCNDVSSCASPKHPETKSRMLLVESIAQCESTDNYVKAYGRMLALQRGLRYLIDKYYDSSSIIAVCNENPFVFTNETFKTITHQLNVECNAGLNVANKLQHTEGYNPFG